MKIPGFDLSPLLFRVFLRNMVSYKRFIIPTFLVSLIEPLFYLITFGVGLGAYMGYLGGESYLHFLVPGVLVSSAMLSSTFECLYGTFVKMTHEKIYDSLISTPASVDDVIAGDVLWGTFRGLVSGVLMMAMAFIMGVFPYSVQGFLLLVLIMTVVGIMFASLAMVVASFAPSFDFFHYYTELIITPMLFFSGVFFPLDKFPAWMKSLADFLPLTHAVKLSRAVFTGKYEGPLIINSIVILGLGVVAFVAGVTMMKRRLIK